MFDPVINVRHMMAEFSVCWYETRLSFEGDCLLWCSTVYELTDSIIRAMIEALSPPNHRPLSPDYTMLHPRRLPYLYSLPWELQISLEFVLVCISLLMETDVLLQIQCRLSSVARSVFVFLEPTTASWSRDRRPHRFCCRHDFDFAALLVVIVAKASALLGFRSLCGMCLII
jgi:hypothetical protein